jgi:high frequency lysogenization protein
MADADDQIGMRGPPAPIDYAALALAGVFQAAALVHRLASGDTVDQAQQQSLLATVPTHRASELAEVFPEPADYQLGAQVAIEALSGKTSAPEILRYALQLVDLAKLLRGVPQIVAKLGRLLDELNRTPPDSSDLARIYQQTISTLGKRIQVTGNPQILQREESADIIRALLLAGVRMAWLWHQLGGRRWLLVLRRQPLLLALQPIAQPARAE